jgi:hypothetical protein
MGTFLMMGLIGLIVVAMIVNIFLASSGAAFAISVIGVLIFAGLTAYDTQNIKNTYIHRSHAAWRIMGGPQEWLGKSAIMGALSASTSTSSTCSCSCCSSWATANRIVLLDDHLFGHRTGVLLGHVEVAGARSRVQADLDGGGLCHGRFLYIEDGRAPGEIIEARLLSTQAAESTAIRALIATSRRAVPKV